MENFSRKDLLAPTLSLFLSAGTLICCALPALFITLGMGAVLAGMVSNFPQLIWLSAYKKLTFGSAAMMLALAGFMQYRAKNLPCPADPVKAKACANLRKISQGIWLASLFIFAVGAFFAFLAPKLFF